LIFFVGAARDNPQRLIRQWPLQRLPRPMARASRRRIPLEITPQAFH
jgi:hypothetical protein